MSSEVLTVELLERFQEIIRNNCHFVTGEEARRLDRDIIRVYSQRSAVTRAQDSIVAELRRSGEAVVERNSYDEESLQKSNRDSRDASPTTVRALRKSSKMPRTLKLFEGALVEMTYNEKDGLFTQGQLAYICELPRQEELNDWRPLKVMLAPIGTKVGPVGRVSKEELISDGWVEIQVSKQTDHHWTKVGSGVLGRRTQYPLALRMAETIHGAMGETWDKMVTSVTSDGCSLWMAELVVVLLSRTRTLGGIYFEGDKEETVRALAIALLRKSAFHRYMHQLLRTLGVRGSRDDEGIAGETAIDLSNLPWTPVIAEMPQEGVGVVYCLRSLKNKAVSYIGQTRDLETRLHAHNSGSGSEGTCDSALRPWHVMGYVIGFEDDSSSVLKSFEHSWEVLRDARCCLSPVDVLRVGEELVARYRREGHQTLRRIHTGRFQIPRGS